MIRTIKMTKVDVDDLHIVLPHDKNAAEGIKAQPATLVFKTAQGNKEIALEILHWRQVRDKMALLTVKIM